MLSDFEGPVLTTHYQSVLDVSFFCYAPNSSVLHLARIQTARSLAGIWHYSLAVSDPSEADVVPSLVKLGLPVLQVIQADSIQAADLIHSVDLVYAPVYCQLTGLRPKWQPPATPELAINLMQYFAVTFEVLDAASYYHALRQL